MRGAQRPVRPLGVTGGRTAPGAFQRQDFLKHIPEVRIETVGVVGAGSPQVKSWGAGSQLRGGKYWGCCQFVLEQVAA